MGAINTTTQNDAMRPSRHHSLTITASALALLALGSHQVHAVAGVEVRTLGYESGQWQSDTAAISVQLLWQNPAPAGHAAFLIGRRDLTSLFQPSAGGIYRYTNSELPLPGGEHTLFVYWVGADGAWELLGETPLRVLTPAGFEQAVWTPHAELSGKAQLAEEVSGDAQGSPRGKRFEDAALQLGFNSEHRRRDLTITSSVNLTGASFRQEALRFGEEGTDAPKLDLSDYQVGVTKGDTSLTQGHVSFGSQPLLLDNLATRGLVYQRQLSESVRIGFTAQNAQRIVGYDELAGFDDADNRIMAASIGAELVPSRPGAFFAELLYLSGRRVNATSFDVGEVADAEESSGYGLRLSGQSESGRLQGTFDYARSTFSNPNDPLTTGGQSIVEVTETTDNAYALDLNYRLLDGNREGKWPVMITMGYRNQRIAPLYRTMTAFLTADNENDTWRLQGQIGQISMQLGSTRSEDNLDDIATILKTRTEDARFGLTIPLAAIIGEAAKPWLPQTISYSRQRVHQFGVNDAFTDPSQIPDQYNISQQLGFNWGFGRWDLGYNLTHADQDNRQPGRELADFINRGHDLSIGIRATDTLSLRFGVGRTEARDLEAGRDRFSKAYTADFDWQFGGTWTLTGNFGVTKDDDSQNSESSEQNRAQVQLGHHFEIPTASGSKLPGQVFLRVDYGDNQSINTAFGLNSEGESRSVHAGLSLSLF